MFGDSRQEVVISILEGNPFFTWGNFQKFPKIGRRSCVFRKLCFLPKISFVLCGVILVSMSLLTHGGFPRTVLLLFIIADGFCRFWSSLSMTCHPLSSTASVINRSVLLIYQYNSVRFIAGVHLLHSFFSVVGAPAANTYLIHAIFQYLINILIKLNHHGPWSYIFIYRYIYNIINIDIYIINQFACNILKYIYI